MKIDTHSEEYVPDKCTADKAYLIHHMHHFGRNKDVEHELHHCFLYDKPEKQGNKYAISHKIVKDELFHVVNEEYSGILYDHINNEFVVKNGIIFL